MKSVIISEPNGTTYSACEASRIENTNATSGNPQPAIIPNFDSSTPRNSNCVPWKATPPINVVQKFTRYWSCARNAARSRITYCRNQDDA